ncbi:unnamed protein product, partial [Heterosigma akashiwo]
GTAVKRRLLSKVCTAFAAAQTDEDVNMQAVAPFTVISQEINKKDGTLDDTKKLEAACDKLPSSTVHEQSFVLR